MAITINVRSDVDAFAATLAQAGRQQLRFATALALTRLAREVEIDTRTKLIPGSFDKPVPFTQRAFRVIPANKSRLTSEVTLKDAQRAAGYDSLFRTEEQGGVRRPERRALVVPTRIRTNAYGNIPNRAVRKLVAQKAGVFLARPGDVGGRSGKWGGVYQRIGRGKNRRLRLLVSFFDRARYAPRFPWHKHVQQIAKARLPALLRQAMAQAMATRRKQ